MMIDPQGQALTWIIRRESGVLPASQWITNLNDKYMKDKIGNCIEGGDACLIQNIENEMDPMLDPVLEKQYVQTGRQKKIKLGDADLDWDDNFRL